jgi:hypothetical protein
MGWIRWDYIVCTMPYSVLTIHCTHYRLDQVGLYSMHHAVLTMHCTHYRLDQVGLSSMHHAVLTMHCTHSRLDQRGASMGAVNAAKRAKRKRVGGKANAATNGLALTDAARHAASAAGTCDALDLMESAMNWGLTVAECNTTFRDPRGGDNSLYKACWRWRLLEYELCQAPVHACCLTVAHSAQGTDICISLW